MTEPMFAEPRRRVGAAEALLAKTLRAWHVNGHLDGPEHSSARGILRDFARAVDTARADMRSGDGTAYSCARVTTLYLQALAQLGPGGEVITNDPLDALLAEFGSGPVRDHQEH